MGYTSLAVVLTVLLIGAVLSFGGAYLQSFLKSRRLRERQQEAETRLSQQRERMQAARDKTLDSAQSAHYVSAPRRRHRKIFFSRADVEQLEKSHRKEVERLQAYLGESYKRLEDIGKALEANFDARIDAFETAHAEAEKAAGRHAFWLDCGVNIGLFVLGNVVCIATTLVLG
jgi:hypothetical protein